jgi:hypothetical protein
MSHREFRDSAGTLWQVWEVHPGRALSGGRERRSGADRRADSAPATPERRRRIDRRLSVSPEFRQGWLAFRANDDRRRLTPIPVGWAGAPDDELERMCAAAPRVADVPLR